MKLKFSLVSFIALGSLKGLLGSDSVVPLEDIIWVVGTNNQSQSQACIGNGHLPFYMGDYPLEWNADSMENIVVNVLGKTVSSDSTSGISGCCAPGLWCIGDECFTQGFGSSFANFGWLSSNYSAKPVYTCYGLADNTTVSLSSEKLSDGFLTVSGDGFGQVAPDLTITVDSQYCSDPEICTCSTCTAKSDCYTGQDCIISSREDESGLCLTSCAGVDDTSCPCDYSCGLLASDSGTFYACIPSDFYKSSTACNVHEMLMCSIPNIYQSAYAPLSSDVVSVALTSSTGGLSSTGPTGSNTDFCSSDADCTDGDLCTLDTCNTDSGQCEYSSAGEECGSILPTIRSRYAPYMYLDTLFTNRSELQAEFNSFMVSHGDTSSVTSVAGLDDYTDVIDLSFSAVFFGNLVTQVGITPYGALSVQPQQPCNSDNNCPLFTTISNAIALWYSNGWSTGTADGRSILRYVQDSNDTSVEVYGISAVNALHVLYQNVSLDDGLNSFGASLYEDGSIRVSYQLVNDSSLNSTISKDEFFGLWGQYAYKGPTRYHQETLYSDVITSGVDVVYCPLSALACVPQSCVAAGQSLVALWNGTDTCTALGPSAQLTLTCSWSGGLTTTAATLDSETGSVSCDVPSLAFPDGSLLFVDVVVSVSTSEPINTAAASSALPGSNSIYMVTSRGQEISRSNLQVRYFSSSNSSESGYAQCGCSALINTNLTCSDSLVCNGQSNDYSDCAGTPFGAAFEDCGGNCMYGMSGVYEETEYCQDDDSGGGGSEFLDLVSQTIILLIIICCMTFVTSTISYSVRRMLIRRRQEEMQEFEFEADLYMVRNGGGVGGRDGANRRGLSEFECDALGTIIFTQEFYKEHKKKQLELMHGIDATPAAAGEGTSAAPASGMGGCDCPICLMDIMEGNVVRALPDPCGHVFHVACIDQWFKQSHVCPLCKRSMRAILEGEEESTSDSDLNPAGNSTTRYASRTAQSGANYDAASRSLATLDRLISRLNIYTANSGGGGGGGGGADSSGANNNNSSSNSDPESGIALTRVPSSNRHAGSDGPVVERSARHFDL